MIPFFIIAGMIAFVLAVIFFFKVTVSMIVIGCGFCLAFYFIMKAPEG